MGRYDSNSIKKIDSKTLDITGCLPNKNIDDVKTIDIKGNDENYTRTYESFLPKENIIFKKDNNLNNNQDSKERGSIKMDENKILEKYMDSVSQNIRDMEKRLADDRKESEKRLTEERRLSEERMQTNFNKTIEAISELNKSIDGKLEKMDSKLEKMDSKIDSRIDRLENRYESLKWWILGTCLATIIGVASMVVNK